MTTLVRFAGVGTAAAAAYVVLSWGLNRIGFELWFASLASYLAIIPLAYLSQRRLAFRSTSPHQSSFPKYVSAQTLGLALSAILAALTSVYVALSPFFAFVGVALIIAIINFLLLKFWAFE